MWTEILTEDIAVTHVGDMMAVTPLGRDVPEYKVRAVEDILQRREARKQSLERLQNLNEQIEKDMEFHKMLQEAGYEPAY
jgi:hypothetical protein